MMRISEDILLFCEDISKTYPGGNMQEEVLKQVNLQFKKGSINLIYGKSGSGKSTLLNILAGLDKASYGDVYYSKNKKQKQRKQNPFVSFRLNIIEKASLFLYKESDGRK